MDKYRVAYVDENDGWLNTFYQYFREYFTVKLIRIQQGSKVEDIVQLMLDDEVDAIVTDYLLDDEGDVDFNGSKIVSEIQSISPYFPIMLLTAFEPQAIDYTDNVHIINGKDILDGESPERVKIMIKKLEALIKGYQSRKIELQETVKYLVEKKIANTIKPEEEEDLFNKYRLLDDYDHTSDNFSKLLADRNSITKLNEFVKNTEDIIKHLKIRNDEK